MANHEQRRFFGKAAQEFRIKRTDDSSLSPYLNEIPPFPQEAPSLAQRKLALHFYQGLSSLIAFTGANTQYPSVLDILELHSLHLETIRQNTQKDDIVPEYSLKQVIGASTRHIAQLQKGNVYGNEAILREEETKQSNLEPTLKWANRAEEKKYPLVTQLEAEKTQRELRQESYAFLEREYPPYYFAGNPFSSINFMIRFFPDEHPQIFIRQFAYDCVERVKLDLDHVGDNRYTTPFGVQEALASATRFAHDDVAHYTLNHVYAASKSKLLPIDVKNGWDDHARNIFASHKLLQQAVQGRDRR